MLKIHILIRSEKKFKKGFFIQVYSIDNDRQYAFRPNIPSKGRMLPIVKLHKIRVSSLFI